MTLAPLVADGKVMVGASGGELGVRGFVAAYDVETGKQIVEAPTRCRRRASRAARPGRRATSGRPAARRSGSPATTTRTPTSRSGAPATAARGWATSGPGDNLYTASTVAIDVATGRIKGHFQYHPNDSWDWDEVSPPILVDYQRNGRTVKGLIDVARNGYLWFLERTDGTIKFVDGKPFVKQNVFRSLDPKTGRPDVDPGAQARHRQAGRLLPVALGRQELAADRVQPEDADDLHPGQREPVRHDDRPRGHLHRRPQLHRRDQHALSRAGRRSHRRSAGVERRHRRARVDAHLRDLRRTGGRCWPPAAAWSFSGGTNDRMFRAFDAASGKVLWEFPTNSGDHRAADRRSRWTASSTSRCSRAGASTRAAMQARLNRLPPGEFPEVPEGGAIWVFALP